MVNRITNVWQDFRQTIEGFNTSRQLAAGVSLGMMVGLMPKDSLLTYLLALAVILSPANLLTAACSAVCFHIIAPWLTPLTHGIGINVLTLSQLEPMWERLIQLPIIPWTRFNNSVLMGSLILGLLAAYPLYWFSEKCFETYGRPLFVKLRNSGPIRWLMGPAKPNLNGVQS